MQNKHVKLIELTIYNFLLAPCQVPNTQHGLYYHFDRELGFNDSSVEHSEVISLTCEEGFQLMGPETIRCWYGEWAVNKMPKCLPGKCDSKSKETH